MQLGFLQNKSCLNLSLFCMRTDDWLNFYVKFQSVHVNITTHNFFFFFLLLHISKICQTQNKCFHVMCTNTQKKYIFCMLLTVSNQSDYLMSRETCVTIQGTSEVGEVFQYYLTHFLPQGLGSTAKNTRSEYRNDRDRPPYSRSSKHTFTFINPSWHGNSRDLTVLPVSGLRLFFTARHSKHRFTSD